MTDPSDLGHPGAGASGKQVVCRFAPSPSGRMHAGNVYAALVSWLYARHYGGKVVMRIEDLDAQRSKPEYATLACRDFEMLGLDWDDGPYRQSFDLERYRDAFDRLEGTGLLYPCFCSRADLHAASAPHAGERFVYAGTCRKLSASDRASLLAERNPAWRIEVPSRAYEFHDLVQGRISQDIACDCGDFIVRRSDGVYSYQLAVVADDAAQGVTCVVRGCDLASSVAPQAFLQDLLGLPRCSYAHVPLIVSGDGRRLSKRDRDAGLPEMLEAYGSLQGAIGHIAHLAHLIGVDEPISTEELLQEFDPKAYFASIAGLKAIVWRP